MPTTVLIANSDALTALSEFLQSDATLVSFSDADLASALESIRKRFPSVVALDEGFARTDRGRMFIERVNAVGVPGCELRLISQVDGLLMDVPLADVVRPSGQLIDTRRSQRFEIAEPKEALVDGNPVKLVNISTRGAQVISTPSIRPNRTLRVTLPDEDQRALRLSGLIAWCWFEIPKEAGPQYRAGLEFDESVAQVLEEYCQRHAKR